LDSAVRSSNEPQPYLICKSLQKFHEGEYFITINFHQFYLGTDPQHAFDVLYKTLYVMDIEIKSLVKFFNFFDKMVYNQKKGKPLGVVSLLSQQLLNYPEPL
jgi:hypothetical protein